MASGATERRLAHQPLTIAELIPSEGRAPEKNACPPAANGQRVIQIAHRVGRRKHLQLEVRERLHRGRRRLARTSDQALERHDKIQERNIRIERRGAETPVERSPRQCIAPEFRRPRSVWVVNGPFIG